MPHTGLRRTAFDVASALSLAVDSIRAHKLRSFLTLLGIIIGVASVIFVGSAIEGLGVYADQSTAKAFGSNTYLIGQIVTARSTKEYLAKIKRNKRLTMPDEKYLVDVSADRSLFSPYRSKAVDVKRGGFISELTQVIGVSAAMAEIRDIVIVDGRFFNAQEEQNRMNVATIGDETREHLFPDGGSPLGKTIQISGIDFTVIGLQEKLGSAFGQSQDNSVYMPVTSYNRLFGPPTGSGMDIFGGARPGSGLTMQQSLDQTRVALRSRYHQLPGEDDKFDTLTPDAIRGFIDSILGFITAIVVPVTCISLVVGGIVIMNIMLVSVTERTREIGIRKALGARQFDIMLQVIIESVLMASIGGAIGVGIGAVVTGIVGLLFKLRLHITVPYVVLSVAVSSIVGIVSGWYPASRAAKLDPINALRSE